MLHVSEAIPVLNWLSAAKLREILEENFPECVFTESLLLLLFNDLATQEKISLSMLRKIFQLLLDLEAIIFSNGFYKMRQVGILTLK